MNKNNETRWILVIKLDLHEIVCTNFIELFKYEHR